MKNEIYYIDCCQGDIKEGNMGFARLSDETLFLMLRGVRTGKSMDCRIYLLDGTGTQTEAMRIAVRNGYGQGETAWTDKLQRADCCGIYIPLPDGKCGKSHFRQTMPVDKTPKTSEPVTGFIAELPLLVQDKWKRLCDSYPQIHLFEGVESIVIKPRDLVVLTKEYQELAVNSFVLHAYYNYRQLLLLRYHDKSSDTYYLGVPGIYYERDKRIAHLFGFEGFENGESRLVNGDSRQAYTGCFGYYMKRVDI